MRTKVVGLIPAGGRATRLGALPCSKELFPIGFRTSAAGERRPKVVSQYLLEQMRVAGVQQTYVVLAPGKWDIPAYFGDGGMLDMHLAYLLVQVPYGSPYTADQAYPFVKDAVVAFGFPDVILQPRHIFSTLLDHQASTQADVVLGLFPYDRPDKADMVEIDEQGRVQRIVIKQKRTHLTHTWMVAVWSPIFTEYMHQFLIGRERQRAENPERLAGQELFVGDIVQAAIDQGLRVEGVPFADGSALDIGTADDLARAIRLYS